MRLKQSLHPNATLFCGVCWFHWVADHFLFAPLTTHGAHHGSILDTLRFLPLATEAETGFLVETVAGPPAPPCRMVRLSPLAVENPSFDAWPGLPATAAPSSHLSRQLVPKRYLQVLDTLRFLPLAAEAETGFLVEAVAGPPTPPCEMVRLHPLAVESSTEPLFDAWARLPFCPWTGRAV